MPPKGQRSGKSKRGREEAESSAPAAVREDAEQLAVVPSVSERHYQVRKTIRSVLLDPSFMQLAKAEGNVQIAPETILNGLCLACDSESEVNSFSLAVEREVAATCSSRPVVETFTRLFVERAATLLHPPAPPAAPATSDESLCPPAVGHPPPQHLPSILDVPPPPPFLVSLLPPPPMIIGGPALLAPPSMPPPCKDRCITLRNVPPHFMSFDAMKPQLHQLCNGLRNVYFLNTKPVGERSVVVSLNSASAASELMARINYSSHVDGSPVIASEATEEERASLWEAPRQALAAIEEQTVTALQNWRDSAAPSLRRQYQDHLADIRRVDDALARLAQQASPSPSERLELLKSKLASSEGLSSLAARLKAMDEPLEGPTDAFSSSTATAGNGGALLFITELPMPLSDSMFLRFFEPLKTCGDLVHVWRDSRNSSRLCIALCGIGQVFSVLRFLDCNDWKFCGARFSRQRPE